MTRDDELIYLRQRVIELEDEVEAMKASANRATDLMMRGESLRQNLMIKAICAGAFNL